MSARQATLPVFHDILCWAHSAPPTLMTGRPLCLHPLSSHLYHLNVSTNLVEALTLMHI
jgi:hypothetical protein